MNSDDRSANVWLWLTWPIAALLTIAAGGGVFFSDLYRDNPYYVAQALGQDLVSLAVVLPTLAFAAHGARRGSHGARMVWLGGLVYLVYTYVIAALVNKYNPLFLVYIALLGFSLYALVGGALSTNLSAIKSSFTDKTPVKPVSIFLAVLAVLFYGVWLGELVPSLVAGTVPQSITINGTPSNAVHVLDMAWILPAFAIASVSLWRGQALGFALAGVLLSYGALLILAILSMVVSMYCAIQPVGIPQVAVFGTLFVVTLGLAAWYFNSMTSTPGPK